MAQPDYKPPMPDQLERGRRAFDAALERIRAERQALRDFTAFVEAELAAARTWRTSKTHDALARPGAGTTTATAAHPRKCRLKNWQLMRLIANAGCGPKKDMLFIFFGGSRPRQQARSTEQDAPIAVQDAEVA
jgi:hypothetical protein